MKKLLFPLIAFISLFFCACQSLEYAPDQIEYRDHEIYYKSVGFYGFTVGYPANYRAIENTTLLPQEDKATVDSLISGYQNDNGIDYHFHQSVILQSNYGIILITPFNLKYAVKFVIHPEDYREKFLKRNGKRISEYFFAHYNNFRVLKHSNRTCAESNSNGYDETYSMKYVMLGNLNELISVFGYCKPGYEDAFTADMNDLIERVTIYKRKDLSE
jgi:hypothetical protein